MTTVSLVECSTPVSLRTCGSSASSLVYNRKKIKCCTPDKKPSAYRSRTPYLTGSADVYERASASPQQRLSLEGALVSSPLPSPVPRASHHAVSPYYSRLTTKRNVSKQHSLSFSPTSCDNSDDFSEEDLDKYVSRDKPENILRIVGSKPKLHGMYDVPILDTHTSQSSRLLPVCSPDVDPVRESCASPENPPPSPINFRPSIEGFVVGGRKLVSPKKAAGSPVANYKTRDFVPGFVKQPLYHCGKCEGKVVEEEQSLTVLHNRMQHVMYNRASPYHHDDEERDVTAGRRRPGVSRSQLVVCNPDHLAAYISSVSTTSHLSSTSFLHIYHEKKGQKEAKEREIQEQKEREREGKQRKQMLKLRARIKKSDEVKAEKSARSTSTHDVQQGILISPKILSRTPSVTSDHHLPAQCGIPDLSVADTVVAIGTEETTETTKGHGQHFANDKCQIRRCWSDIWSFSRDIKIQPMYRPDSNSEVDAILNNLESLGTRGRITSLHSLPSNETPDLTLSVKPVRAPERSTARVTSVICEKSQMADSTADMNAELLEASPSAVDAVIQESHTDSTMTATVIVPQRDRTCTQWITFNGDNEPILNNTPAEDGTDNFLKRLQRSKLCSNSDPTLPGNSQFCFEAIVDKRYNRWKRRRQKKKESDSRRSSMAHGTDSSDENEDNSNGRDKAIERIIDRMYDQINGRPPQTPKGTRDTPRMRNRRRRLNNDDDDDGCKIDGQALHYDASSEWTSSDKDGGLLSSSSGACNGNNLPQKPQENIDSNTRLDDSCSWPYLEQYKEEIMRRVNSNRQDESDELNQNDWLPDINLHKNGTGKPSNQSVEPSDQSGEPSDQSGEPSDQSGEPSDQSENEGTNGFRTPVEQEPIIRVRDKSETSAASTPEPGSSQPPSERAQANFSFSKWSRSERQGGTRISFEEDKPKLFSFEEDKPKLLSMTSASSLSEMRMNPCPAKRVGVNAVGENNTEKTFKAAVRPIKHGDIIRSPGLKPTKKPKETLATKNLSVNLPALTKNAKLQTVPKLERSLTKTPKVTKRSDVQKDHIARPKTQPQMTRSLRKSDPPYTISADKDLLFRDYFLRSLYHNKGPMSSHAASSKTGMKLKRSSTVGSLEVGGARGGTIRRKAGGGEDHVTSLAFTRSFTFSMFDLPEIYKLYNTRLERQASGLEVTESR